MRKHVYLLLLTLVWALPAMSQQVLSGELAQEKIPGAKIIRLNDRNAFPTFVKFLPDSRIGLGTLEDWMRSHFNLPTGYELEFVSKENDEMGFEHFRFHQHYNGVHVKGGVYLAHVKNNFVYSINGRIIDVTGMNVNPSLSETQAINKALAHVDAKVYKWQENAPDDYKDAFGKTISDYYPTPELTIVPKDLDFDNPTFKLVYEMDVYALEPNYRSWVSVDAQNGEIVAEENRICFIDVPGTAVTKYHGTKTITTDQVTATSYRLYESGRGGGIHTKDMNNGSNYSSATEFTDTDNHWNNVNVQQDEVATDAHHGTEVTYDYFLNHFNRNSFDNNGTILESYVHYGTNYQNAFWNGSVMTYGDGDPNGTLISPLTTVDVCGHEVTHGVTEYTAGLIYASQSGALNESFSDIFGIAIDFESDSTLANWRIGDQVSSSGLGFRNMANPNEFSDPDTYTGTHWTNTVGCSPSGSNDYCGVHSNSGVQNYWFYLLVNGGSGTNDLGNAFNVTGIGMDDAAAIAYRNLSVYLTPSSTFADAQFYAVQAATDLFGGCSNQVSQTVNAWYAVGVGGSFSTNADFTADKTLYCATPATVQFLNSTFGAQTSSWDFGDGTTDTLSSPIHTYTQPGNYTVKLVTTNCSGVLDSITKNNFIVIDTTLGICDTTYMPTSGSVTVTDCAGILVDDGGPNGNHSNSVYSTVVIQPASASAIQLNFQSFQLESCCDNLQIYDGPSTSSPFLGSYTGSNLPSTITSSGNALTIVFYTDGSVTYSGFIIEWTSLGGTAPPVAAFTPPNNSNIPFGAALPFTDNSSNGGSWFWEFGDGTTSTDQNPSHAFMNSGTYNVKLTTSNCLGSDDTTMMVTVQSPPTLTLTPDSINVTLYSGDTTTQYLTLANTGLGDGYYDVSQLLGSYDSTSLISYQSSDVTTYHNFTFGNNIIPDSVKIKVTVNGDYDGSSEYADLYIEGIYIKQINDYNIYGQDVLDSVTVSGTQLATWLADGVLDISVDNSYAVDAFGAGDYHIVEVSYEGEDWLSGTSSNGILSSNSSVQIPVFINAFGLLGGTYSSEVYVNTNDSISPLFTVPVNLTVIGTPVIGMSPHHVDFGNTFLGYTTNDTVILHNYGTDPLQITSITHSNSAFSVTSSTVTLPPFSSTPMYVSFSPTVLGTQNDTIVILNNDNDTVVTLTGMGVHPPTVAITPSSLNVTVVQNNTKTEQVYLDNTAGAGPLSYSAVIGDDINTIFSDGFESGNYNNFTTGAGNYFYQMYGPGYSGGSAVSILGGNYNYYDGLGKNLGSISPETISFAVLSGSTTARDCYFTVSSNNPWTEIIDFYANSNGTIGVVNNSGIMTGIPYTANTWYFVEFKNIDYFNQTYDFHIGGQLIAANLPFNNYATTITDIYLYSYDFSSSTYDDIYIGDNLGQATWMSASPASGNIPANTLDSVAIIFDATGVATGVYTSSVIVNTNDPANPSVTIPTQMTVIATPASDFYSGDAVNCNGLVTFTDLSQNIPSSWLWDFGDGTSSTVQSPVHTYTSSGIYSVSLITCNLVGCDTITKANYVFVDLTASSCSNTIPTSSNIIKTACSGTIFDDGGANNNYSTNINTTLTIQPPNATAVTIDFSTFNLYGSDYVYIYDGPSTGYPYIGSWSGTNTPPSFTSSGGAVTIIFSFGNNGQSQYPGFELNWSAVGGFISPVASFNSSFTNNIPLNVPVQFTNTSWNYGSTYWDFGDGTFSLADNPSHNYASPGTYTITMTANNCAGTDTATQVVTVQGAPSMTVTPDSLNITLYSDDTTTQYLTIANTGLGVGYYSSNVTGVSFDSTSQIVYTFSGAATNHSFTNIPPQTDSLKVRVTVNGDFDSGSEYADLYIEGNYIQSINDYNYYYTDVTDSITLYGAQLASFLADGVLNVTVDNTSLVDIFTGGNYHIVEVSFNGLDWLTISNNSGTVEMNDSVLMPVFFDATDKNGGVYTTDITINTNDGNNPTIVVPATMTVIGIPNIQLSNTQIDFGNVFTGHTATDSVTVRNTGSDLLTITSISNNESVYTVFPSSLTLNADDSAQLYISYSPTALVTTLDTVVILNNDSDTLITLSGTGVLEPSIQVTPDSFHVVLPVGDSTYRDLMISNIGQGDLLYDTEIHGNLNSLYYENFESGNYNSLSVNTSIFTNTVVTTNPASGQYCLEVQGGANSHYNYLYHDFVDTTLGSLSFKVNSSSNSSADNYFILRSNNGGNIFFFYLNNNGNIYMTNNSSAIYLPYVANQWYHIEIKNMDYVTQSFDYYVDGVLIQAGVGFSSYATTADQFWLYNFHNSTAYYDDIQLGEGGYNSSWLSLSQNNGTTQPNQTDTIDVKFNAANLTVGVYNSTIIINANDPDTPQVLIPVILEVIDYPSVNFLADKTFSCDGVIQFTDKTLNGASSWLWEFGDGNTSTLQNPLHYYQTSGTYNVKLVACNNLGCDSLTKNQYLTVNFSAAYCDTLIMPTNSTSLTATSCTGVLYDGGGPNGNYSNNSYGEVVIEPSGAQSVTITFNSFWLESCCDYVRIYDGNSTSATLLGSYNGSNIPPSITSSGGAITITFSTDGSATYSGFEMTWQCTQAIPNATFSHNGANTCNPTVQFTNNSTNADSYLWDFGDGTTSTSTNPIHTFSGIAVYNVSLTATNSSNGLSNQTNDYILIGSPPAASFTVADTVEKSQIVPFTNTSATGIVFYVWDFGNGQIGTVQHPTTTYSNVGNHTVSLIGATVNGCFDTITKPVLVIPYANFTHNNGANACDLSIAFTNNSSQGGAYAWNFGDGNTSSNLNPTHTYSTNGTYTITLTVTENGYVNTYTETITIHSAPTVDFIALDTVFKLDPIAFTDNSDNSIVSWLWDFDNGLGSTNQNSSTIFTSVGYKNVSLIGTNNGGCTDTITKQILVLPKAEFQHDALCDVEIHFTNSSSAGGTYVWNFGDGNVATTYHANHFYTTAGTYNVQVTVTDNGFTHSYSETITIHELPEVNFLVPNPIHRSTPITFTDSSGTNVVSWYWDFGNGDTSTLENPTVTFDSVGIHPITLVVTSSDGCENTIIKPITVLYGVGTNTIADDEALNIFPNPTNGIVHLDYEFNGLKNVQIIVTNSIGQVMLTKFLDEQSNGVETTLDLSRFSDGVYIIQLEEMNDNTVTKKIGKRVILHKN